ncbi:glycosyltransferase family 2 protein [Candidatus Woesebacteria bacterium]|jgi:glycosyltransferase involved in cell wall biosynthesis|nr:glycosyltransferase family 2 protein [Candidatus Woesebacteria bacterium]
MKLTVEPMVSLILPIYNERDIIPRLLKEWDNEFKKRKIPYTFIACEDGSTDGTTELLVSLKKKYPLLLWSQKTRRGYGKAVLEGIAHASSEYILFIDSDGQCDPRDFYSFWSARQEADIISGWRVHRADTQQRKIFSLMFKMVFIFLFPTRLHDPSAPYVFGKTVTIRRLVNELHFLNEGFWWGFIGACKKHKLSIKELPIHHRLRKSGITKVYVTRNILSIAVRNIYGLFRLWAAKPHVL